MKNVTKNVKITYETNKKLTKVFALPLMLLAMVFCAQLNAQNDVYTFDYIYKMEIETPRGRKTVIDYYLPSSGGYFCSKTEGGVVIVYDNVMNKMFTYMGEGDGKIVMSMPFNLKSLVKDFNDAENPEIYESAGYGNILGYECELFRMTSNNLTSEVWVAKDVTEGSFGENAVTAQFFGYILARGITVNDDSLKAIYSGLPLKIVTSKKRGNREKITTMLCTKFEKEHFQINTAEYGRL
tara:strand:+ start:6357 stop:7073 length:717 start_codon:yes stop_codon:yes gene_type:complete